jgi:proline racemase
VDTHAGTPMRVITGGIPHIRGNSVYEKMKSLEQNDDQLRKLMLREPRGYPAHCCNIIVPPSHPEADAGYIIMEQIEYPVMSGGNTISVVTVLLEMGMLPMKEPVTELVLEAPAGLIRVNA